MQTMNFNLSVRVPIDMENMQVLAEIANILKTAHKNLTPQVDTPIAAVTLTQTVESDEKAAPAPTPPKRVRGANKAKANGAAQGTSSTVAAIGEAVANAAESKPDEKMVAHHGQPAWRRQAEETPEAPGFLSRQKTA